MSNNYSVKKGKIYCEKGLPILPRWFADDKVAVQNNENEISEVQYFNPKTKGSITVFFADMWGGMRFLIDEKGEKFYLDLYDTETMPYGFTGKFEHKKNIFSFEQRIINDSIYFSIAPLKIVNDVDLDFSLEMYDAFGLKPHGDCDIRISGAARKWSDWKFENNSLYNSYSEEGGETYIVIRSNVEMQYQKRTVVFYKNVLLFRNITANKVNIAIAFDWNYERADDRANDTVKKSEEFVIQQNSRYQKVMDNAPILQTPYEDLNNFAALAPVYHEAVKVTSYEGAIRAKTDRYWVWGWDGMSSPYAYGYWGDVDYIGSMLAFYRDTANEEKGIAHNFGRDMSHLETSMIAAQGFYINLLYQYFINGRDITEFYPFAKKIFELLLSVEVDDTGLCSGLSLFPDYRELILENGNDISCFNNSSAYCAIRAMEEMAKEIGDNETYARASEFAKKMKMSFNKYLFDENKGFYFSSVDSVSFEKRPVYMGVSVKWDNPFCHELVEGKEDRCLAFYENNFVNRAGIRPFTVDNIAYDADANQAHCYWPAHSEFYTRLVNRANRKDLTDLFIDWINRYTALLMCPEGINCYVDTDKPYIDAWNSAPGTWQTYSLRAWYEAVIHSVVGVDVDKDALTFYPYAGEEMSVLGLNYKEKKIDVHMKGSGTKIGHIILNGKEIKGINKIPNELLDDYTEIYVYREN